MIILLLEFRADESIHENSEINAKGSFGEYGIDLSLLFPLLDQD
jgi:hypothetical protein